MTVDFQPVFKRARFTSIHPMESESAKAKLAAAKQRFGHEIKVFETSSASSSPSNLPNDDEQDEFYEFTAEDYYRLMATKKEDKYLKTRKIWEAEEAARRSRITKQAVIRVRFPDNYTLEAVFHPSETIQSLVDLLLKVINHPELPFYIYTTPPKNQIRDTSQDFYAAGFVPGAIVYFAYDLTTGDAAVAASGPFLVQEVMSLQGLEIIDEHTELAQAHSEPEPAIPNAAESVVTERKPADKKNVKPKWLKM